MQLRMKSGLGMMLAALSLWIGANAFAQDTKKNDASLTHGEAAVLLVQRLHLVASGTAPISQTDAMALLLENNMAPFGGWKADAEFKVRDLAKVLVEALGGADDISDNAREDVNTKEYQQWLVKNYGLNVLSTIAETLSSTSPLAQPQGSATLADSLSTDPLRAREEGGGPDETVGGVPGDLNSPVGVVTLESPVTAPQVVRVVRRTPPPTEDEDDEQTTPNAPQPGNN